MARRWSIPCAASPDAGFGPLVAIVNVPKSRVYGAEIAASVAPVDGLTVSGALTYIDTKITRFTGYDVTGALTDLSGERFNLAPKWSGSMDANYSVPLDETTTASIGGGLTYRSKTSGVIGAAGPFADLYDINAYTTVDLQAGIESSNGWLARLWGRNIFNTYYWTNVNRVSDTIVRPAAMPATYGVTVGYKF